METEGKVTFKFTGHTSFDEEVRLIGNLPILGSWHTDRCVSLITSSEDYPVWTTPEPIKLPLGSQIEYKYCFVSPTSVRWEELQLNRQLQLSGDKMLVEDEVLHAPADRHRQINETLQPGLDFADQIVA